MAHDLLLYFYNSVIRTTQTKERCSMSNNKDTFEVKKTFGLSVLLKLTRKNIQGIEISEMDGRYRSNLAPEEMNRAVIQTMESHNISLKVG